MSQVLSRDPSGYIFKHNNKIYRAINHSYRQNYEHLINSGLYQKLCSENLLIPHSELCVNDFTFDCYKIIAPIEIEFISHPYEWSFQQLKDAAATTLLIQKYALEKNMSLKDASAYNIQFLNSNPILIDTLSFEIYKEGYPWIAYKQFCQHFIAPLALMSKTDIRIHRLLNDFTDGIPLDLANAVLPIKSKLNPKILLHISLHSKAQKKFKNKKLEIKQGKFSKKSFFNLIDNLVDTVNSINLGRRYNKGFSNWVNYYDQDILNLNYLNHKKQLINTLLDNERPRTMWDLGSNIGTFGKIATKKNIKVISFDSDPLIINNLYSNCKKESESNILPLILDFTIPTPPSGWLLSERASFFERPMPDLVMALALIHHLAIANNIPMNSLADFFSRISKKLIIEFIPKTDPNAKLLLLNREDIFEQYNQANFEKEFQKHFRIKLREKFNDSERVLYLMEKV